MNFNDEQMVPQIKSWQPEEEKKSDVHKHKKVENRSPRGNSTLPYGPCRLQLKMAYKNIQHN